MDVLRTYKTLFKQKKIAGGTKMAKLQIVPIDHGNRNIKTLNHTFAASIKEVGHLPEMGADTLLYKGKEYALVDKRMAQKTDKTQDEDYFILTLFAISKELASDENMASGIFPSECIEVVLLVGLPPLQCRAMGEGFIQYLKRGGEPIHFQFNKIPYAIRVVDAHLYPQAYAAAITALEHLKGVHTANIVDIGGFTADLLRLIDIRPDMTVCTSLHGGVNLLFQKINEQVRATGANNIPDAVIEGILLKDEIVLQDCASTRVDLVQTTAALFAQDLLQEISQAGLDLAENRTVFVGGGSILLRDYINNTGMVAKPIFVDNARANVQGYQLIYNNRNIAR